MVPPLSKIPGSVTDNKRAVLFGHINLTSKFDNNLDG